MCIEYWFSRERFYKNRNKLNQAEYDSSLAKNHLPVELDVAKVHQKSVPAHQRPDSITLPMYARYHRSNNKSQQLNGYRGS